MSLLCYVHEYYDNMLIIFYFLGTMTHKYKKKTNQGGYGHKKTSSSFARGKEWCANSVDINTDAEQPSCSVPAENAVFSISTYNSASAILQSVSQISRLVSPRTRTRKAESTTVLTSSQSNCTLQEKDMAKNNKKGRKTTNRGDAARIKQTAKTTRPALKKKPQKRGRKKGRPRKRQDSDTSEEEAEQWSCIVCAEMWADSTAGEVWVESKQCNKWTYERCTSGTAFFFCPNCDSDVSDRSNSDDDA